MAAIVEANKPAHVTASEHPAPAPQPPGGSPLVPPTEVIPVAAPEPPRAPPNPFVDPASGSAAQPLDHTDPGSQP